MTNNLEKRDLLLKKEGEARYFRGRKTNKVKIPEYHRKVHFFPIEV